MDAAQVCSGCLQALQSRIRVDWFEMGCSAGAPAPVRVKPHETCNPNGAAESLLYGLREQQECRYRTDVPHQPIVGERKPYREEPEDESQHHNEYGKEVAHIAGTEVKASLQFKSLPAFGTMRRHPHRRL